MLLSPSCLFTLHMGSHLIKLKYGLFCSSNGCNMMLYVINTVLLVPRIKIFESEGNERDQDSQQFELLSCQLSLVSDGIVRLETSWRFLTHYVSQLSKTTEFLEGKWKQEGELAGPKTKKRGKEAFSLQGETGLRR